MAKTVLRGSDLERWRIDHGFVVGTAAECFGIQKKKWEQLTSKNEYITSRRLINLYLLYVEHPNTVPVPPSPDYIQLFKELELTDDIKGSKIFADLLGISLSSALRILESNNASREIEKYVQALERTGLFGLQMKKLMTENAVVGNKISKEGALAETKPT